MSFPVTIYHFHHHFRFWLIFLCLFVYALTTFQMPNTIVVYFISCSMSDYIYYNWIVCVEEWDGMKNNGDQGDATMWTYSTVQMNILCRRPVVASRLLTSSTTELWCALSWTNASGWAQLDLDLMCLRLGKRKVHNSHIRDLFVVQFRQEKHFGLGSG